MAVVNVKIPAPQPPGQWVDESQCDGCGARYLDFHNGMTFAEAADALRIANGGFDAGGGYRSRGPVLWVLRVNKLAAWYCNHYGCEPEPQVMTLEEPGYYLGMYAATNDPKYLRMAEAAKQ